MTDTAGNAAVTREYAYDSLARPVTRRTARQGNTVNDSFACNSRSELTAATVSGKTYGYSYDNIGVVIVAAEANSPLAYVFIFLAAVLGTMNVVGGYVVTDRMLEMFKSSKNEKKGESK